MVVEIDDRPVGDKEPTYLIAEAGINHNGELSLAKDLVIEAAEADANAVKFQTYETEKRVEPGSELFDILGQCELSRAETRELFEFARDQDVSIFSTPFDKDSVAVLDELGVPAFKIASFHITHKQLLRRIAATGRPAILSTGMATMDEIRDAVEIFESREIPYVLLHCVSSYPTEPEDANLAVIRTLDRAFDCPVGFSDHTLGTEVPSLSVGVGADVIEKHFTLDSSMDGPDHDLSVEPAELARLVEECRRVESILGDGTVRCVETESATTKFREQTE
jgi:N-acetylneuraminate synthase/N,N'-diacetyllegionaminate synthase